MNLQSPQTESTPRRLTLVGRLQKLKISFFFHRSPKPPEIKGRDIRINSQSEMSTLSNVSMMKQSTPEISRMHMQSPEQSRIASNAGDKFKLETTPVSGFSSIHEKSFAPNMTQPPRRFILSPGKILLKL